MKDGIMSERQF